MKTQLKISVLAGLALVAGLSQARAPMAGGYCDMVGPAGMQGMGYHHRMVDPARMQTLWDKHHAALKTQLKLTAAQEAAWTTYVAAMTPAPGQTLQRPDVAELAKLSTPERIDKMREIRAQHMGEMAAAMDKRDAASKAFYAVLTPEQQKIFDAQAMPGRVGPAGKGMGPQGKRPV